MVIINTKPLCHELLCLMLTWGVRFWLCEHASSTKLLKHSVAKAEMCYMWLQCLSIVPIEIFRWVIAGVAGFMSASFVALNLRAHIKAAGERWFLIVAAIFLLQVALAIVLKFYLFTVTVWEEFCSYFLEHVVEESWRKTFFLGPSTFVITVIIRNIIQQLEPYCIHSFVAI